METATETPPAATTETNPNPQTTTAAPPTPVPQGEKVFTGKTDTPKQTNGSFLASMEKIVGEKKPAGDLTSETTGDKAQKNGKKETAPPAATTTETESPKDTRSKRERMRAEAEATNKDNAAATTTEETDPSVRADDPPRFRERIKELNRRHAEVEKSAKQAQADLQKAQDELTQLRAKSTELPADVKAQLEELPRFRRRFEIENDPEIKTRFDTKIELSEKTIDDILKTLPEWGIIKKVVTDAGGFGEFGRLRASYRVNGSLSQKENGADEVVTTQEIYNRLLGKLAPADAEVVRGMITDQARLKREKVQFIQEETGKAKEYFETKQKQAEEGEKTKKQRMTGIVDLTKKFAAHVFADEKYSFFKDVAVPDKKDKAAHEAALTENKERAQMRELFEESLANPTLHRALAEATTTQELDDFGNMLLDASRVFHVERELKKSAARVKELEGQVKRLKDSSATTGRPGVTTTTSDEDDLGDDTPERREGESPLEFSIRTGKPAPLR